MLTLSGRVKETQQVLATQFSFRLRTPDLFIKVSQTIQPENSTAKEIKISVWIRFLCFVFLLSRSQSGMPWSGRRCQWRSRLLTHSHRCWRRSNSMWRDWAFRLLTQFIMGEEANQTSCCALFFFNYPVYLVWLPLSFPVSPSEILAAAPPCLWPSTSSPPCPGRGNYWLRWTAGSSHRFTVW